MNLRVLAGTVTSVIGIAMVVTIAVAPTNRAAKPAPAAASERPAGSAWTEAGYKVRVPVSASTHPAPKPELPLEIVKGVQRHVESFPTGSGASRPMPSPPPPPAQPAPKEMPAPPAAAATPAPKHVKEAAAPPAAAPAPQLYAGRILFQPEMTMHLRVPQVVMIRMDAGASPDLETGIDAKEYSIDSVPLGLRMRVHLSGNPPDAFDIVPVSPPDEQQGVTNVSAATWMWNVTPKKDGSASLLVQAWALSKVDGSDTLVPVAEKTEIIHVSGLALPEINASGLLEKVLDKLGEKAGDAMWSIAGVGLTALGGWIARWWRKPKAATAAA